ncbi:hypothetical protein MSAN_00814200 [Mycena sanguinolenta]|uniref:Uncharacterized protein n=1 Tax=Mycena sanguinolenta TaxID=230812 RepID=A0A8H7DC74_9AGAR|nr:hypothetical protein MSAN_00814200 [Mycena sanguinolenta]
MASRSKKLNPDGVQPAGKSGISLPEEILSEILSVALAVPDEVFSDNGPDPSPFATLEEPSSSFLLVCKAWFRCGCRQLYKVIVLRSTAQAKALAQVLSNTAELGQYVEKLRVEGGYGASMRTILKCSPNISHLFLALDITAGDATTGLCDGLPLINPTCVILRHKCYTYLNNKMMRNLTSTLGDCFSRWDNLQVIDLPRALLSPDPRFRTIFDSLKKSITLHTVVIPEADYADASQVALRLKETGLRNIKVKNPIRNKWEVKYGFFDHFAEDPTVTAMLQYTVVEEKLPPSRAKEKTVQPTNIQPSVAPSPNSSFIPMDSASVAVRESVWKRVLYFAMFILEQEADIYRKDLPQRLPLLLVSKTFNKLALPHYYSFVSLKSARTIPKFLHILVNHPTVGPQVRVIFGSLGRPQAPDPMATILSLTSRLQQFHHRSYVTRYESGLEFRSRSIEEPSILSWDAFAALAKSSGSTLREFSQQVEHGYELWPTQVFNRFTQLTSLDWKSPIEFDSIQLSSLQRLTLSENISDATKLLHSCGSTLAELTLVFEAVKNLDINLFVLCPNLTFVVMCFKISSNILPHVTDFVSESIAHHHLTRFKFKFPENYWSSNRNRRHTSCWDDIFEALPTHFPNLREIQLTGFAWPKTEREIAKSFWVKLAERFLESGVTMMDADGKKWRGRLESKRSLRVNRT